MWTNAQRTQTCVMTTQLVETQKGLTIAAVTLATKAMDLTALVRLDIYYLYRYHSACCGSQNHLWMLPMC